MKKTLKMATACALLASPAMAATTNLENPLYMPSSGEVYSKIGAGVMYKKADDNLAMRAKDHAGEIEFPIWRGALDIGVGVTDWLSVRGQFGYTHDGDINRQGMNNGRLGLNFRASDFLRTDDWVWDIYADAHLGGISPMKANMVPTAGNPGDFMFDGSPYLMTFDYDNYSNGRWGAWLGTQVGKTFDNLTVAAFGEVLRTFGNDNNKITVTNDGRARIQQIVFGASGGNALLAAAYANNVPDSFSVDTKSTWEYNAGLRALYEVNEDWSIGGAFTFKHRAANTIDAVNINVDAVKVATDTLTAMGVPAPSIPGMVPGLTPGIDLKPKASKRISKAVFMTALTSIYCRW